MNRHLDMHMYSSLPSFETQFGGGVTASQEHPSIHLLPLINMNATMQSSQSFLCKAVAEIFVPSCQLCSLPACQCIHVPISWSPQLL